MANKILVLEDEEELGRSIKKFLEQHNYQVTFLSDIARVETITAEMPDLILTDLLMPHFHGFDICREVKDDPQLKNIPLIAMTAVYKDAFHKLEAMRIGVSDFLDKPFKFSELLEIVEKHLGAAEPVEEPVVKKVEGVEAEPVPKEEKGAANTEATAEATTTQPSKAKPRILPEEEEITPDDEITRVSNAFQLFEDMKQDYSSHLPEKVIELEQIWGRIQLNKDTKTELAKFHRKVHSLAGSGTTFGFDEISEYARQIEFLVDMIIAEGEKTITRRQNKINELLDKMRHHPIVSTELEIMRQLKRK